MKCVVASKSYVRFAAPSAMECLEPRRLFSAAVLNHGRLTVYGSDADNSIAVFGSGRAPTNKVVVSIDGAMFRFNRLAITRLRILGEGGVNHITLSNLFSPNLGDVVIQAGTSGSTVVDSTGGTDYNRNERVSIFGGAGDDRLTGGARAVLVDGGPGNDTLCGGATGGLLEGGDGNDLLAANVLDPFAALTHSDSSFGESRRAPGTLTLSGGAGDDTLVGNSLDLSGGDHLSGGDGNDTFYNYENDDFIDFGDGNDQHLSYPPVGNVQVTQTATLLFHIHTTEPLNPVFVLYPARFAGIHGFLVPIYVSDDLGTITMMGPTGSTFLLGDLLTAAGYPASVAGIPPGYSLTVNGLASTLTGNQIADYKINNGDVVVLDFTSDH